MALKGEAKNQYNKNRYEEIRKFKKLEDSLVEKDAQSGGHRYKSETLSYSDLLKIYLGQPYKEIDEEDEVEEEPEEDVRKNRKTKKVKKKKSLLPNPSKSEVMGMTCSFDEWLELRDKARKNLFWLGVSVLRHDFVSTTHQVICDQFVQKNFDDAFPEGYTIGDVHKAINRQERFDQDGNPTKEALILDPRGFYKSTISRVDCVQWMINVPDIRILLITGENTLAKVMMVAIKKYLCLSKGEKPTAFHLLFPEYVLTGRESTTGTPFTVPCRKHNQTEPTFWVRPVGGNLSGWHCDVKKGDDVITDKNCNKEKVRDELNKKYGGTNSILDEWGFADSIGTRYFGQPVPDWYGLKLRKSEESSDSAIKVFVRKCWEVKPEYLEVPLMELTEEMVILNFPEKATFRSLRSKLLENEKQFRCQQLNEPAGSMDDDNFKVSFDADVLQRHLRHKESVPQVGDIFICWDWALTANKRSDYSAGVVGRVYRREDGRTGLVILEVVCDKWTSSELALQIIGLNKKWNPKKTLIENSTGSEWLKNELQRLAPVFGVTLDIFWRQPSLEKHAKRNRIKGLETLLKEDLLWFVIGSKTDQTFEQLTRYTGEEKTKGRKDDIPDAMSYFHLTFFPVNSMNQKDAEQAKAYAEEEKKKSQIKAQYDRIFGKPTAASLFVPPSDESSDSPGWRPVWPIRQQ